MVGTGKEKAEPRECRQRGRETCVNVLYNRRLVRGSETFYCAVLRETNLTARKALSRRASDSKLGKLRKQERRDRDELARKIEKLKNEPEATE